MYRTAELQVTAETYRKVIQTSLLAAYREQVGERLRGVGMAAVATVSATVSPLLTDDEAASENPSTLPPNSIMADVKLRRVRVLGS